MLTRCCSADVSIFSVLIDATGSKKLNVTIVVVMGIDLFLS